MTLDPGDNCGNQLARLADLDHRDQCAILVESGQASAEVVHLRHGAPLSVCLQRRWCHSLAARPIASLISRVTDAVLEAVREWQNRPLDPVDPVIFFDALRAKIRDEGLVRNKAV